MFTVQKSSTRKAARVLWALWAVAAFWGGSALQSQAQPAPPNDNLINAQGINGVTGTVQGTNLNATVQVGEPNPLPTVPAQSTIWYVWTAPISSEIDFNTRSSTSSNNGAMLGTTLGVYQLVNAAGPPAFSNLTEVVGDEFDSNPNYLTSRVSFSASLGTTYFIQVGSATNIQGYPVLNWNTSLQAGGFAFSTGTYLMSSLENFLPDNDGSITPSIYGLPEGTANARITVTRYGGNMGRCEVTLNVAAANYTNVYETNYLVTNIFMTNYSTYPPVPGTEISFTNIFLTNVASINNFGNFINGGFELLPSDFDYEVEQTNYGTFAPPVDVIGVPIFMITPFTSSLGLPDFFTNFPCPINPPFVLASSIITNYNGTTSSNGLSTIFVTNRYCSRTITTMLVPAAIGTPGSNQQFVPFTRQLTFDDYQMSQDIYVQLYPFLNTINNGGFRDPELYPSVVDYPTFGAESLGNAQDFNYIYPGLNGLVQLSLSGVQLDPLEEKDIIPPTISQTNAYIGIADFYGDPNPTYSNSVNELVPICALNLERYTWRCNKDCDVAVVWVQRSYRGLAEATATHVLHYTIDSKLPEITWIDDNGFATVADSDYAVPMAETNQTDFDFLPPLTSGDVYDGNRIVPMVTTWAAPLGELTLPQGSITPAGIYIPIVVNGAVEFDEDIEIQLVLTPSDASADTSATPPAVPGSCFFGRLTINFDNDGIGTQPAGAADKNYNAYPGDILNPGANASVNAVAIDSVGRAVIGGEFDAYDNITSYFLARVQTDGLIDNTFTSALGRGPNTNVNAVAIDSAGRIIIGGNFTSVNGTNAHYIARLQANGAIDTTFASGFGFNGNVYALAIDGSGNILVGGDFTSYNTTNCNHITRLLPTGGMDTNFLPSSGIGVSNGTDNTVRAVTFDSVGNVILGGNFTHVNGTNWNYVARLLTNGTLDPSFSPGFGADGEVLALAVQSDNSIVLGGAFHNFNLYSRNSIARLTPGGVLDSSFLPGTGFNDIVYSLVVQPADGNILVGGQFTLFNGTRRVGFARLLGGQGGQAGMGGWLDTSFMDVAYNQFAGLINPFYNSNAITPGPSSRFGYYPSKFNQRNQVLAMALQPADGNIIIGGSFTRIGGGFYRDDVQVRVDEARIIGLATEGAAGTTSLAGGLGNDPGNIGMTQNPYTAGDVGEETYIFLNRVNGSLGPLEVTLATNTLPPSSTSATSADYGLLGTGLGTAISYYSAVLGNNNPTGYGWRSSDAQYGDNFNLGNAANLFLQINNDPGAAPIIYADLSLLNLNANNLFLLGGVLIPFGPALGQYSSQLNIINDNFPSGTIGFSATNYNVLESAGTVTISLSRINGSYGQVSVQVNYTNGTAKDTNDFMFPQGETVTFAGGITSNSFTIPIVDHSQQTSNKFFNIYLSSPTGGASLDTNNPPTVPPTSIVTIIDDHFQPGYLSFSSPTYSVLKPGLATITVNRSGAALDQVSVSYGTSDGTASNGTNYVGVTGTLSWNQNDILPKTFTVQTLQDDTVDGPKTVNLFLTNAVVAGGTASENAQVIISPSNAVLTIIDTDTNGYLNFLTHNYSVFENAGQAVITVTRTGLGTLVGSETVNFTTYDLTNVQLPFLAGSAGSNYGAVNGQLTFPPGVTSASFTVPVYQSSEASPADRLVGLELFNGSPTNIAGLFPEYAVLTILDPALHINSAGSVDTTTENGTGFNGFVNSLSLQPDSSILAGGSFSTYAGYPYGNVARMLANGSFDTGFLSGLNGANGTVSQILSQPPGAGQIDGNIMIVGAFTQVDQINSLRIARLDLDGGLDVSFNPGTGADGTVYAITNMSLPTASTNVSTNYIICGAFANYDGNPAGGVARVTYSGAFDTTFNLGFGATGTNAVVYALALTPDNHILVGGDFTSFDNQAHHHLVELNSDGTLNTNFSAFNGVTTDINGSVRTLAVQPDGRILIGGLFTTVNGGAFNYIARLNADGTTDTNFNVGVGCNNDVDVVVLDDQLRILVGGAFTQASGVTRNGLTRLNPDGTVDPSINFGFGANGFVDTILIQTNDEINVGGGFTTFDNLPENNFARLYGGANAGNGMIQFALQTYGILESPTSQTNAIIGIQRLGGTFGSPSVSAVFSTSNNTSVVNEAIPGVNYTGVTNTVTFQVGETFQYVDVPILPNAGIGPDLFVTLELTNPAANSEEIGPQVTATLIITNNNEGVEFAAQGFNQSATAGSVAIPVVRVGNTNSTVSVVVYTGTNGTATPFTNYVPNTNVLIFYPGVITNYWLITILDSPTTFQDTTVDLEMEDATNAVIASPSSALLTINSVQSGPGYLTFSQTNYTVSEGAGNAVITVLRTNGSAGNVQVTITTSNGTATAGVNYSNATTNLYFAAGQSSATDNIPIIQLGSPQPNTTVILTLSNPQGFPTPPLLASPTQAVLTIVNDIAAFSFGSSSYFVSEGSGMATLTILRTGPISTTNNTVYYSTYSPTNASETNGYAVPYVDYVPTNGTVVFQPGVLEETIPITILQTTNVNPVLSFQVQLMTNASSGAQVGVPGTATVGIISDVTGFSFVTNAYYVGENGSNVTVVVNRLNANTGALSVNFATTSSGTNDNAIPGVDYVATNGTLNFLEGQATNSFTVQILNPNLVESNKMFNITLSSPSSNSYVVAPSNAVVTITNVYVGLSFGSPSFTVSECSTSAIIPVELSGLTNVTISVAFGTEDGSGMAGVNYDQTNGTLTFLPGQTVQYFYVTPINDHIIGPDHTVQLNLTNLYLTPPVGVAGVQLLTPSTALLTIAECNGADIIKSGTAFVTGNILPSTGVIYSNETVTILFGLRDISGNNASNLLATLLLTNGITSNGIANFVPTVNYGTLIQNGPTVSRPFTFTVEGSNGQNITATLALSDEQNPANLNPVSFGFTIGGSTVSYTNTNTIFLYENATAPTLATNSVPPSYGYPSLISVTGVPGLITKATVTFSNFGHSYPQDVDAVLEAPNGSNSILMSHVGSGFGVGYGLTYNPPPYPPVTLTFDQTAAVYLPLSSRLTNGTYLPTTNSERMPNLPPVPTNEAVPVAPPEPAFGATYAANLNTFLAASPNGNWSLWALCDETGDSGYISNGWVLNISTGVAVENDSDLEVTVTTNVQPTVDNLLVYSVTVTNFGPSAATNVVITDYLPSGAEYLSNSLIGAVTNATVTLSNFPVSNVLSTISVTNGALTLDLPWLATNGGTSFEVYVLPTNVGNITNIVTALALEPDPNTNNYVTNVNLVNPASAEVAITLTGSPDPAFVGSAVTFILSVTNNGPSDAGSVTNVLLLPAGFVTNGGGLTASTGSVIDTNGIITWVIPDLPSGSSQALTAITIPTVAGIGLCQAFASSGVYEPLKGAEFASVKIEVDTFTPITLGVTNVDQTYELTWSAATTNYMLQGAVTLPPPGASNLWHTITSIPMTNGFYIFTLPGANTNYHYFRLSATLP